jgi:DNA-binding MarR family transcriptional regulator
MSEIGMAVERAEAPAGPLLQDQLRFALYAAQRALTNRYRPLLDELDLTHPQYLLMLVLWEHGALPIKTLATLLQLDYGTLTPLLKRLQAHGLIRRERQVDDERSVQITLTEQGVRLRERAHHPRHHRGRRRLHRPGGRRRQVPPRAPDSQRLRTPLTPPPPDAEAG